MAITQEFLSQCSDDQINKGVAWCENKRVVFSDPLFVQLVNIKWNKLKINPSKYCENPHYSFPIILREGIGLSPQGEWWEAYGKQLHEIGHFGCKYRSRLKNPLRAAMEVYILMMVAK